MPSLTHYHSDRSAKLPVIPNRYRLIWSSVCPYATRSKIVLDLLELDRIISTSEVHPVNREFWDFHHLPQHQDPIIKVETIKDIYIHTNPDYQGPYSVPAFVDTETGEVINSESLDIAKDFIIQFEEFHGHAAPQLYPQAQRKGIDVQIEKVNQLNQALASIVSAENQNSYHQAMDTFFQKMDEFNQQVAINPYLNGQDLSLADICLFVILSRFDAVYYYLWDANRFRLSDFTHLWTYAKKLYAIPAFAQNTNWQAMKEGFYLGKKGAPLNPRGIVPEGHDLSIWNS